MIKNILIIGYGKIGKRYLSILRQKKVNIISKNGDETMLQTPLVRDDDAFAI